MSRTTFIARGWTACAQHALQRVPFPLAPPESVELEVLARMLKTTAEELARARAEDDVPDFWPIADTQPAKERDDQ
jgi:hypothetical protein